MKTEKIDTKSLKKARNKVVLMALEQCDFNRGDTAKTLGISIRSLTNYIDEIRETGIEVEYGRVLRRGMAAMMASNVERLKYADNPTIKG